MFNEKPLIFFLFVFGFNTLSANTNVIQLNFNDEPLKVVSRNGIDAVPHKMRPDVSKYKRGNISFYKEKKAKRYFYRAIEHSKNGEYDKAIKYYKKAHKLDIYWKAPIYQRAF